MKTYLYTLTNLNKQFILVAICISDMNIYRTGDLLYIYIDTVLSTECIHYIRSLSTIEQ